MVFEINLDSLPGTYYNMILQEAFTLYYIDAINGSEYREQKIHKKKDYYNKKGFSHWEFYLSSCWKSKKNYKNRLEGRMLGARGMWSRKRTDITSDQYYEVQ